MGHMHVENYDPKKDHHKHHHKYEAHPLYDKEVTTFDEVESRFLGSVTDDMFLELTYDDTVAILDEILIEALPWFRNPREVNLLEYDLKTRKFKYKWDELEVQIVLKYMTMVWVQRQLYQIDLVKQKYSGSDFKFTSQASHIKQLITLKQETEREGYHLCSDYYRRKKDKNGIYKTTMRQIMEVY